MTARGQRVLRVVLCALAVGIVVEHAVMLGHTDASGAELRKRKQRRDARGIFDELPTADYLYISSACPACAEANDHVKQLAATHPEVKFLIIAPDSVKGPLLATALGRTYGADEPEEHLPPLLYGAARMWHGVEEVKEATVTGEDLAGQRPFRRLGSSWEWLKTGEKAILERLGGFSWHAVALAGLIDGINPCALATIVFLLSFVTLRGIDRDVLSVGLLFAAGCFIAYLGIGMGLLKLSQTALAAPWGRRILYPAVAFVTVFVGMTALTEFFKGYRKGKVETELRLPDQWVKGIHGVLRRALNSGLVLWLAAPAGMVVTLIEFGCTGQVYLPTITYIASHCGMHMAALPHLLVYNAAFIVPLLGVITAHHLAAGKSTQGRRLPVHYIRLGEGLLLSALGTFMLWATYQAWATY